ncbi:MAG: gamma-glutamylcyclotransferase [Burkholderiales bacterium]|nr:gamma-glutamylcyclotransferase [Burkholderiales bacterium]
MSHSTRHEFELELPRGDLWIFGYGSLMWNPGFPYIRSGSALLRGYHRTFCIYSDRYRGTPEQPGLVLGLNRGGACRGIAYLVAKQKIKHVLNGLWTREMSRRTYRPRLVRVELASERAQALTFVADPAHPAYAGGLAQEEIAAMISRGVGARGANIDYLINTLSHLEELGVRDPGLRRIHAAVRKLQARDE